MQFMLQVRPWSNMKGDLYYNAHMETVIYKETSLLLV